MPSKRKWKANPNPLNAHEQFELLVGEIGIDINLFLYHLKLWQILSIIKGYRKRETNSWRIARWQTFLTLSALGAKEIRSPQDLLPLPGDETEDQNLLSEDVIADLRALIKESNKKQ